jgi:hypothetical protein
LIPDATDSDSFSFLSVGIGGVFQQTARQASGVETYATRLLSTPERRDGLYWPVERARPRAGPLIDSAQDAGYPGELVGVRYFRILQAQDQTEMAVPKTTSGQAV